ncbi:MAG: gamma-glutamyl-gamma-aminobutyrate hydrolase family protein [Fusicatenibacter sp.]|nr:gamma-glutamyl-gamma-aminobutyrate hydrolase family protein [Lachnospiraceae bacterium]MDY2937972.1 gamma-glutamyl-gamma-aminobutyrate hydrolase family protein [Fusicatenibacter sp.]
MSEKPIIGILGNTYMTQPGRFSSSERVYINSAYANAILKNGGIPIAIPAVSMSEDPKACLDLCDGLLVPGGEDMNPWYYGEEPLPQIGATRPEIDEAWFAAGRYAMEKKMPMFGICKGIQFLNVLCGGTLYQDVYTQRENSILHLQFQEKYYLFHHVEVKEGTYLARILGAGKHPVNSMHHQAVKRPGENLVVSALAPDGTIEAIESTDRQIVAVQWHPEELIESAPEMNRLFADLVERSCEYKKQK